MNKDKELYFKGGNMKKYYQGKRITKKKDEIKKAKLEAKYWEKMADAYIKLYDAMLKEDKGE